MSRFLIDSMEDARRRTLRLVDRLDAAQLMGPGLSLANPLRWEIGHTAYFYEYWILRQQPGLDSVPLVKWYLLVVPDPFWHRHAPTGARRAGES